LNTWWHLQEPDLPELGQWMGFFRRSLAMRPDEAKCAAIPKLREEAPKKLDGSSSDLSVATLIAVDFPETVARRLGGFTVAHSLGGTVTLAEPLPLSKEQISAPLSHPSQAVRNVRVNERASVDAPEIPLWRRLLYLLQPPVDLLLLSQGPLDWPSEPYPYQREGILALYRHEALLLADDMGLGKTIQAIGALRLLIHCLEVEEALIVTPAGLVTQWQRELRRWAPELRLSVVRGSSDERSWQWAAQAHVFITSYETLRSDMTANPASPPRRRIWGVAVLDEAQKIKNPDAEVSGKCKLLPRERAWALTGTPLENSLEDLASVLDFVRPFSGKEKQPRLAPGPALMEKHRTLQLRRKKKDVLPQLPSKVISHIFLPLSPTQQAAYSCAEREGVIELRRQGQEIRVEHVLALITRLKQICNFCPSTGQSAKLEDLLERMAILTTEGHRAIIFSQFTDELHGCRAIAAGLQKHEPLLYTGELTSTERDKVIDEFKQNPKRQALILSLRAGGQGLNLQEASYVFHFDRWWNPAVEHQAEDRSHRLGQVFPVNVYKYTCEKTIEERIDRILRRKQALFDEWVDDVSIDLGKRLSREELLDLFDLLSPAR
jgi:SNF2 family DNA or RNA helicase